MTRLAIVRALDATAHRLRIHCRQLCAWHTRSMEALTGPELDDARYRFYLIPAHLMPAGPGLRPLRQRRVVPGSERAGGTFRCPHMSIGGVTSVTCKTCGPLVPAPEPVTASWPR